METHSIGSREALKQYLHDHSRPHFFAAIKATRPKGVSESYLSRMLSGERRVPDDVARFVELHLGHGTTFLDVGSCGLLLGPLLLALQHRQYKWVVRVATALIRAGEIGALADDGPEVIPKLYALRGSAYYHDGDFDAALTDYARASESARRANLPQLHVRYEISMLSIQADQINTTYRPHQMTARAWRSKLERVLDLLLKLDPGKVAADQVLRHKGILRNASRLDLEQVFETHLHQARKLMSDRELRTWMAANSDKDEDFKHARGYACFQLLKD